MKAFLSSTYEDLIEHRKLAIEALRHLGQEVGHMELFGARSEEPIKECFSEIEASDIFIGIYAHRYGFIPNNSKISITELEFDHAVTHKKKIFCFLIDDNYPWSPKMIEKFPAKSKLERFKQRVRLAFVCDHFTSPAELAFKISSCIGSHLTQNISKIQNIERILKVRVHKAYFMNSTVLNYFINITNLSPSRVLEITHIWYEDENNHIPVFKPARPLPVRLEVDQSWETWIEIFKIPQLFRFNAFSKFRVRISTGEVFHSEVNSNVPPVGTVPGGPID